MAISKTTTDYTGKRKDISIFQYPDALQIGSQDVAPTFGKNPRFCAGVQKLIQKYAIVLLTNISSQSEYPDFGTNFLYRMQSGVAPKDTLLASQIFYAASHTTVATLQKYQVSNPAIPLDERIASAELVSISLLGGYVAFAVRITTATGDTVPFIVPLPK